MSAGKDGSSDTVDWYVEPNGPGRDARGRRSVWARPDDERANSLGLIVTTSLLFVLFAAAVMFGGHAAIAPLMRRAVTARAADGKGDIVYAMPDGVFCRHMSFDNATGAVIEGAIAPCTDHSAAGGGQLTTQFKWGAH